MHNPLQLYSPPLLQALMKAGHRYFVRQRYPRGIDRFDGQLKGAYLLSYYSDINKATAHFEGILNDGSRFLYDISNSDDLARLNRAAGQPPGYRIFAPLLEKEWVPSDLLKQKIKKYVDRHIGWKPSGGTTVNTNLFIEFGELFITLKLGSYQEKVALSDIERI